MEYPTLSLSAASIGLCEQGITPFYDIVWSFDYYLENITPETEFGFLFFLQDDLVKITTGGTPGPGLGYVLSQYTRPDEVSTYLTTSGALTYNTIARSGLEGGLLGVGFDSTGCYALSVGYGNNLLRDGKNDKERIPNSVAIRGGAPHFSYDKYSVNYALTNFNIIDSVKKTVRARLGNLGRTIYIDYRYRPDQDFIPLLTQDVDLGVSLYNFIKPGITFTKNISSSSTAAVPTVIIENIHLEGKTEIPVLDPGAYVPPLTSLPPGPQEPDPEPEIPEEPFDPPPEIFPDCKVREIRTLQYDGSPVAFATVLVDGATIGVTDASGILFVNVCNGYRVVSAYKDDISGRTELYVDGEIDQIFVVLVPADRPEPETENRPQLLPAQSNTCTAEVNVVSAFITGYDEDGNPVAEDLYNYGYAIYVSGLEDILYRVEPFRYINNTNTIFLEQESFSQNWILTDYSLNRFAGSLSHPIGVFVCGLSTINLAYYNG